MIFCLVQAMHGKEGQKSTSTGGEDVGSEEQDTAALVSGSNEVPRLLSKLIQLHSKLLVSLVFTCCYEYC